MSKSITVSSVAYVHTDDVDPEKHLSAIPINEAMNVAVVRAINALETPPAPIASSSARPCRRASDRRSPRMPPSGRCSAGARKTRCQWTPWRLPVCPSKASTTCACSPRVRVGWTCTCGTGGRSSTSSFSCSARRRRSSDGTMILKQEGPSPPRRCREDDRDHQGTGRDDRARAARRADAGRPRAGPHSAVPDPGEGDQQAPEGWR